MSVPAIREADKCPVGLCPRCGEPVERTPFGWACAADRDKCGFVIFQEVAHRKLPSAAVRELVQDLATSKEIHGFISKAGKEFSAKLYLDKDDDYKVKFRFEDKPREVLGKCPCGGDVVEFPKSFSCLNWQDESQTHITIWREIAGYRVSQAEAKKLLAGEEVGPFQFKSKAGKDFRATLHMEEGKVEMTFAHEDPEEEDEDY